MKISSAVASLVFAATVNITLVSSAAAYIDPGTGTMMLQVAGALIAAGLFYLRNIRLWIADKLGFGRRPAAPTAQRTNSKGASTDRPSGS
jgi:hypothetical protein